jgi:AAHS family 4-hydroxybenzoate transporter-like MFS transporter
VTGRGERSVRRRAFAVLGACLVMDGFDVQAMGYAAPALVRDWGVSRAEMGPVFSAALAGLFLGSILAGMLADRIGRRPVLLGATCWFAAFTLLTAYAGSIPALLAARFLAGLGLGAIMPNATALVGEHSPPERRIALMMIVTNGFMVGAVLGGFASAWLVPALGWRSVFQVGGLLPLAILAPMYRWLPESPEFRAGARAKGVPILRLAREGRAVGSALLCAVSFLNVLNAYFVSSWLPTVVRDAGYPTSTAVLVGTAVQMGGALGTFALGAIARRVGIVPLLAACFGVAAASLAVIAHPALPLTALVAVAFVVGWGIFGGQPGLNALAATYYPTDLRATGVGAALGVGRFGAILGPLAAGELMRRHWSSQELFQLAAAPAAAAMVLILAMRWVLASRGAAPGAARAGSPATPST